MRDHIKIVLSVWIFVLSALVFTPATGRAEEEKAGLRYNQAQWKAAHNSYHQKTDMMTQLRDWNIRSIEFDFHASRGRMIKREQAPAGDFLVFHGVHDAYSNCRLLSDCFETVAAFHRQQPEHEVITIFYDMQGVGEPGHTKADLYALMRKKFGNAIFTPGDLLDACSGAKTLQESVTKPGCGWPLLDELKGKIIMVVSDGRDDIAKGYDLHQDLLFLVSKGGGDAGKIHEDPNIVFFNMGGPNPFLAEVQKSGFVSRSYWLNSQDGYLKAKELGANHLATDRIDPKEYPWANIEERH